MVVIYKASKSKEIQKIGYSANYVADINFRRKIDSGGFIQVSIPAGSKSESHVHNELEEVFVILSQLKMNIDNVDYDLEVGDVVLVSPGESHSFEAPRRSSANIIAIKFPNLKSDRSSMDN